MNDNKEIGNDINRRLKERYAFANDQLSEQNYIGMVAAQQNILMAGRIAKKSPNKNIRRYAKSASFNISKARKYLEMAESDYTHKFRVVFAWRNERELLDTHLRGLYSDLTNLNLLLENPTAIPSNQESSQKKESLLKNMLSLRSLSPQLYGGLEGTLELLMDAQDMKKYENGQKLTLYEQYKRERCFNLAQHLSNGFIAFGALGLGASFGLYNGLTGRPSFNAMGNLNLGNYVELSALGISMGTNYLDILLQRSHSSSKLGDLAGATFFSPLVFAIGHFIGYAAGEGIKKIM